MASANAIARYLIHLASIESERDFFTHSRLQKLLYYVQGWSLVADDLSIFKERIEAWVQGPVIREVDREFAHYEDKPIDDAEAMELAGLSDRDKSLVASVWHNYKQYSGSGLRARIHQELPWKSARSNKGPHGTNDLIITIDSMREFFISQYNEQCIPGLELDKIKQAQHELAEGRGTPLREVVTNVEIFAQ